MFSVYQSVVPQHFIKFKKSILLPVIHTVHQKYKNHIFKKTCSALDICGDGRSDFLGYSAIYGTCSLMNSVSGKILNFVRYM